MKNSCLRFLHFLLLTTALFYFREAYATHGAGTELTYRCLGGNTYELTLCFYNNCAFNEDSPDTVKICVQSVSCNLSDTVVIPLPPGTNQPIVPVCPTATISCYGGSELGVLQAVYIDTVTLGGNCSDWIFQWGYCCRYININTLPNPTSSMYVEATLDNLSAPGNSSPYFSNYPFTVVCLGKTTTYNFGATDPDGDSLVYALTDPLTADSAINYPYFSCWGSTGPVIYNSPITATQPITSSPLVSFDNTSGDMTMTPQVYNEISPTALIIKEFRKGKQIGSIIRDVIIYVDDCGNNTLPVLSGMDNIAGKYKDTICFPDTICFDVLATDPDTGTLTMSWNNGVPSGTFTISGNPPKGTFCWKPTANDINKLAQFTVTVKDNACPYNGTEIHSYGVYVQQSGGGTFSLGADTLLCDGDTLYLNGGSNGTWQDGTTASSYTVTAAGTYWVELINNCGKTSDSIVVTYQDCSHDTIVPAPISTDIFVPNAFSPNGDGQNDKFFVRGHGIKNFTITVYDRWGEQVFQTSSQASGWDGKNSQGEFSQGVFVYHLTAVFVNGNSHSQKGTVSILK